MTTNDDLHELVASYALGVLDPDERKAYEEHLAGCEQCRADLAELTGTVGALGLAAEPAEPPDWLRGRILDAARDQGPSNVVSIRSGRRRFAVVGVAAAVAAAGLAIGLYAAFSGGSPKNRLAMSVATHGGVTEATVTGLDAAPAGKAYEIWVIRGAAPRPAGFFQGGGKQVVRLTRPAPGGSTVAVTLERAGGARAPTTPVLVSTKVGV
jgi:anti-sigma factor RsiW